jgi:type II secretory pathway predicted ATPase ExeA
MHLRHFGLKSEPFGAAFEPDYFYRGHRHAAALKFLEETFAIGRPAFALTGPQGTGKSASIQYAMRRVRGGGRLGQIDGLAETPVGLLNAVLGAFGFGAVDAGHTELRNLLSVFVVQARQNAQKVVLHIRDPQLPSPEVADELHWLLRVVAREGGFQVAFSGGETLKRWLDAPRSAGLAAHVRDRHSLLPLDARETADYLRFRLEAAGARRPASILPDDACEAVHVAADGVVRMTNRIASAALAKAGRGGAPAIDRAAVGEVVGPLGLTPGGDAEEGACRLDVSLDSSPYMRVPLGQRKVLIGRHSHNELNLRDGSVSRHHAMVVPDGDHWVVVDLNSTNGTLVNGERVRHRRLQHGDAISIGCFRIDFSGTARSPVPGQEADPDQRRTVVLADR